MGFFGRVKRALARVFGNAPATDRSPKHPSPAASWDAPDSPSGDTYTPESALPKGWEIEATVQTGVLFDPYNGTLPAYTQTLGSRVVVAFTHSDGHKSYRTIHGPIRDEDQIADIIERETENASPPV